MSHIIPHKFKYMSYLNMITLKLIKSITMKLILKLKTIFSMLRNAYRSFIMLIKIKTIWLEIENLWTLISC